MGSRYLPRLSTIKLNFKEEKNKYVWKVTLDNGEVQKWRLKSLLIDKFRTSEVDQQSESWTQGKSHETKCCYVCMYRF